MSGRRAVAVFVMLAVITGGSGSLRATTQIGPAVTLDAAIGTWATFDENTRDRVLTTLVAGLSGTREVNRFLSELRTAVRRSDPRLAATFVLELAEAAGAVPGSTNRILADDLSPALQILKTAWPLVDRKDVNQEWARAWYSAAVALWQGPAVLRRVPRVHDGDWPGGWYGIEDLVTHARRRMTGDPEFEMAWGLIYEQRLHHYAYTRAAVRTAWSQIPAVPAPRDGVIVFTRPGLDDVIESRRGDLEQAASAYAKVLLTATGRLRATGLLHMGSVDAYSGAFERAERHWRDAETSTADDDVRYLAALFTARLRWEAGHLEDALPWLNRARGLKPHAQSAAAMLMSIEFLKGNRAAAAEVSAQIAAQTEDGDDPWVRYLRGAHAAWPARLSHLRSSLLP